MTLEVLKRQTILIASRDRQVCSCIEDIAEGSAFSILKTDRITELLLKVLDVKIDLLLLDLDLVGLGGLEVIQIVKRIKPNLPVIVTTSDNSFETGKEIAKFGVWLYLLKPIGAAKIESAMNFLRTKFSTSYF